MDKPLISLCIPTNGVVEWVLPVLNSIFEQGVSEELFEVVVTDNGTNEEFYHLMMAYRDKHTNILYEKTTALPFLNEIESYKRASGEFIKFLNHRTQLLPGALKEFLSFVQENLQEKPVVYFANGMLEMSREVRSYSSFDEYVRNLSYWSSWSTGMGFWNKDFEKIPEDTVFNELFPHTTILFRERDRAHYIIDNRELLYEMPSGNIPKGRYDLFHAFAVEYPGILCDLLRDGSISSQTFLQVKEDNLKFIAQLYNQYVIRKNPCSYDLSGFDRAIQVFYSKRSVKVGLCKKILTAIKNRFKRLMKSSR